ncbi:hypothetical protein KAR91_73200 [Candidatus Pacearchaeota archaeon]|nr:hypothetical protein [Candidatus Pacearchaeota archaeon]
MRKRAKKKIKTISDIEMLEILQDIYKELARSLNDYPTYDKVYEFLRKRKKLVPVR